jgi:vitamin B12 transporter
LTVLLRPNQLTSPLQAGKFLPPLSLVFHNFFGSRTLVNLTRREAGENPALPRNCKRGNLPSVTGETREGRSQLSDEHCPYSRARRPARTVHPNPFRVTKEERMRFFRVLIGLSLLVTAASAADLRIKVVDPQSAAVAGAQVELFRGDSAIPAAIQTTSADGVAVFRGVDAASWRARVLAAGFAEQTADISSSNSEAITLSLHLAPATETITVSATRTLVPGSTAAADVEILTAGQLEVMRPVAADGALRFLPGAVVSTAGQRGGLSSLFVRGGESTYNKIIVDGVPVNNPGETFDFGVLPLAGVDRLEFVRGAQSTLYGSDAMTSVVQLWTRTGSTAVPELRFGADGGNLGTANGYASLAGAKGRFDYNLFGDQFNTMGQGPNDDYSNSLQGGNVGVKLTDWAALRVRARHSNRVTGVQSYWNFNGDPILPPDLDQRARQHTVLASAELALTGPSRWQHRFTGFEYRLDRTNIQPVNQPGRVDPFGNPIDTPFHAVAKLNRVGFDYQGDYTERSWAQTTVGYELEDEEGTTGSLPDSLSHGVRLNHAVYGQQVLSLARLSIVAGARFVHNQSFGNRTVPRVAVGFTALRGGQFFSGTRFRFSYATGIKEPSFAQSFGNGGGFPVLPNPGLKPERARSFEAGVEQKFSRNYWLIATYFNGLFRDKIDFNFLTGPACPPPSPFCGQNVNVNQALAHGAEVEFHGRPLAKLSLDGSYTYTSTQILEQPFVFDPLLEPGQPLIRRPRHSGSLLLTYLSRRWGANLGGSFIGRRTDSDFLGYGINHAAGYGRGDLGGWYAVTSRITAYVNLENAFDKQYQEVVGYPALGANVRTGMRFRIGGE